MKFLDELRAYLERPEAPRPVYVPDVGLYRRRLLDWLETHERDGRLGPVLIAEHSYWSGDRLDSFLSDLTYMLRNGLGYGTEREEFAELVRVAFDRSLFLSTSTGSHVKDTELDAIGQAARGEWGSGRAPVEAYATRIRAVRRTDHDKSITPIGRLVLELPERDALRWLLSAEVVQSHEPYDPWRISRDGATALMAAPKGLCNLVSKAGMIHFATLERLSLMGIIHLEERQDVEARAYEVSPLGLPLLEDIASGNDTPFMVLARALLQDETAAVLDQYPAVAALVRQENAATIATRHARLVAHEVRNALVPIRVTLSGLYRDIERRGQGDVLEKRRERIDADIEWLFAFVRDVAETADLAAKPPELFQLAPAIETAADGIRAEIGRAFAFVQEAELPPVLGHRDRFVLALANILRNAAQARQDPPVEIRVTAGVNNGAEVFVRVDDDGPGVALEDRPHIFAPGFSRRPGGSGVGLALVREVVETEMAGAVAYEESPMGGARFVVRLPVGTRRSK